MASASELEMLRDSVRTLIEDHRPAHWSSACFDGRTSEQEWRDIAKAGWLLAGLDEELGGFGKGPYEVQVIMEEIGAGLCRASVLPTMLGLQLLSGIPAFAERDGLIAAAVEGRERFAFAFAEASTRFDWRTGATRYRDDGDEIVLDGSKTVVAGAADAGVIFVAACSSAGAPAIIAVPVSAVGLAAQHYVLIDGSGGSDLRFEGLRLPSAALLAAGDEAGLLIEQVLDFAVAATCSEAVGAMRAVFEITTGYVKERVQFGQPVGANQALQHRLVDMLRAIEEAATEDAVNSLAGDAAAGRRSVSAAKVLVCDAARLVSQEAVQMHGAIGTTDESVVSHYFRRLIALRIRFGDAEHHLERFVGTTMQDQAAENRFAAQMNEEDRAFSKGLRAFIAAELDPVTRDITAAGGTPSQALRLAWEQALGRKGWLAYTWSQAEGGAGLSMLQQFLFEQIGAEMNAPRLPLFATKMVGPVLNRFGSPEQKSRFLPGILSGETAWCQGYSEPGSGSDLASLKMSARRDGDHYVLNGQKIWTTGAHYADWIFVLARTSQEEKRQQGISFILVDMKSPGITVRPIVAAYGSHSFNEVFFDNVRVPVGNLVGEEGKGWTYAKYLLSHERLGVLGSLGLGQAMVRARRAAARPGADGEPLGVRPAFRDRLAHLEIRYGALNVWVEKIVEEMLAEGAPGRYVSLVMITATRLSQDISAFTMDALGPDALPFAFDAARAPEREWAGGEDFETTATANYIYQRVFSILGGTTEIQKNIIAKTVLDLPAA